jgi:hypothetical protein
VSDAREKQLLLFTSFSSWDGQRAVAADMIAFVLEQHGHDGYQWTNIYLRLLWKDGEPVCVQVKERAAEVVAAQLAAMNPDGSRSA